MHLYLLAIAALQGVTELFPISSLGHSILIPALFHWPIDRTADWFLPFIVVLHLGTATALLIYFWRDWARLIGGWLRAGGKASNPDARLLWLIIVGTIPAGLLGLLLAHKIKALFGGFTFAAIALMLNGLLLLGGDFLKHRRGLIDLPKLGWSRAFLVGLAQALALIPGFSRSGATLVAGLGLGLNYADSAKFSFLLATPIIAAAGVLEVPKLLHAGVFAWLSTWFLMRWFTDHEMKALRPFGIYCLLLGAAALLVG